MNKSKRPELEQALAKAIYHANCGEFDLAQKWGEVLIRKLELAAVFKAGSVHVDQPLTDWVQS